MSAAPHVPVLIDEVLDALAIAPGEVHVDGTFGAGGYSSAMADAGARVFAFDRDPDAIREGQGVAAAHGITLIPGEFSCMAQLLAERGVDRGEVPSESPGHKCRMIQQGIHQANATELIDQRHVPLWSLDRPGEGTRITRPNAITFPANPGPKAFVTPIEG